MTIKTEGNKLEIQSFCTITYGCTFNKGDTLKIEKILIENGFTKQTCKNTDLMVINTCAVKHATEAKIIYFIKKQVKTFPKRYYIITGCLPQISLKIYNLINGIIGSKGFILNPHNISEIFQSICKEFDVDNYRSSYRSNIVDKSFLYPYNNKINPISVIQISEGCNNSCSYCCTTIARGKLVSFNNYQIVHQIENLYAEGVKEFHLSSQDLGNYSYNGKDLYDLLLQISKLEGNFQIRLGMMNPEYLRNNCKKFLKIFNDKRFYRFLHIPIQSGSDRILKKMNRKYNKNTIDKIFKQIYEYDPNFTISTDIIAGFPTETTFDHKESINFIVKWKPTILNISKYSVRPNTKAKNMPQLRSQLIKKRSSEFTEIFKQYSDNIKEKWIGWEGRITITRKRIHKKFPFTGRNLYYLPVLCKNATIGKKKNVKIIGVLNNSFIIS